MRPSARCQPIALASRTISAVARSRSPRSISSIDLGQVRSIATTVGAPFGNSGFEIAASNGVARVTTVVPDGVADQAGLVVGDVINAIDGVDVTCAASRTAVQLMSGDAGTTIVLELERGVTVTIVLA